MALGTSNGSWGTQLSQVMPGPRGVTPSSLAGGRRSGSRRPARRPQSGAAPGQLPGTAGPAACSYLRVERAEAAAPPGRAGAAARERGRGAAATLCPYPVHRAGRGEAEEGLLAPRPVVQSHAGCPSRRGRDGEQDPG